MSGAAEVGELGRITHESAPSILNSGLGGMGFPSADRGAERLKAWSTEATMMKSASCAKCSPGQILKRPCDERRRRWYKTNIRTYARSPAGT